VETDVYRIGTLLEMVRSAADGPEHCVPLVLKPDPCEHKPYRISSYTAPSPASTPSATLPFSPSQCRERSGSGALFSGPPPIAMT